MEKEEFEKLFERYVRNELSEQELEQLMQAVKKDQYDVFLKDEIYTSLKEDEVSDFMDEQRAEIILNTILSESKSESKLVPLHPQKRNRKKTFRILFAAAGIAVLAAISSTFLFKSTPETPLKDVQQTPTEESALIAFSGKQLIHLPDGSTVLLNDNSSLEYNKNSFDDKTREVTLTGEAFFDIQRNEKKAFIVHTGKVQTKVLGTAFNINARKSSAAIEVTVARGKVQVGDAEKVYGVITPNQQIKVEKNTLAYQQSNINATAVTQWKNNYLILDDISMDQAVALISEKYKVKIQLNENIKNCRITASFLNDEDLDHILKVVCSVMEINYHYTDSGAVVIDGKGC
ncbi:FecR family protein [Flavobacterium hercynium]|nr:FecR domain-containing protein [Flavobacterium hercynium]SMP33987.1 FecR family protein [Flavobacterium hercynium]